jgi:hypothetical protein
MTCANVKRNGNKRLPWQRQQRDTAEEWQSNGQEKCHCKVKAEPRFSAIFNKDVSYDTFLVYVSASAFETPHSTACTSGFGKLNEIQCLCVLHAENAVMVNAKALPIAALGTSFASVRAFISSSYVSHGTAQSARDHDNFLGDMLKRSRK